MIRVEIVYAQPQRSVVKAFNLPPGALIADALRLAAADQDFQGIDWSESAWASSARWRSGISRSTMAIESKSIGRSLEEPKLARRQRARRTRQ